MHERGESDTALDAAPSPPPEDREASYAAWDSYDTCPARPQEPEVVQDGRLEFDNRYGAAEDAATRTAEQLSPTEAFDDDAGTSPHGIESTQAHSPEVAPEFGYLGHAADVDERQAEGKIWSRGDGQLEGRVPLDDAPLPMSETVPEVDAKTLEDIRVPRPESIPADSLDDAGVADTDDQQKRIDGARKQFEEIPERTPDVLDAQDLLGGHDDNAGIGLVGAIEQPMASPDAGLEARGASASTGEVAPSQSKLETETASLELSPEGSLVAIESSQREFSDRSVAQSDFIGSRRAGRNIQVAPMLGRASLEGATAGEPPDGVDVTDAEPVVEQHNAEQGRATHFQSAASELARGSLEAAPDADDKDSPDLPISDLPTVVEAGSAHVDASAGELGYDNNGSAAELTDKQRETVRGYTGTGYDELNSSLWSGTVDHVEKIADFSHDLSGTLEQFPRKQGVVYRGSKPGRPAAFYNLERYEAGEIVVENGYLSASTDAECEFGGEVLWVINSLSGREVADTLSSVPGEHEVLFDHFTRFEVKSKTFESEIGPRGRWLIYMEEAE